MPKIIKLISSWLPPLVWMGLIYFLSSFHKLQATPVFWADFITRKTAHMTEYAILSILLYRALKNSFNLPVSRAFWLAVLLTILYSISDEYHQTLVSGRTGRPLDIGFDSLGALAGGLLIKQQLIKNWWYKIIKKEVV